MRHSLRQLFNPIEAATWLQSQVQQGSLHTDSRKIKSGDGFIAWPGAASDGRQYVASSLNAGAQACLVEQSGAESFGFADERIASYSGLKADSGRIAAEYYGHPSQHMDVVAVTGTNGKTSTAWWIAQALNALKSQRSLSNHEHFAQYSCGLVGTLGIGTPGAMQLTGLTTPDPVMLQAALHQMRSQGASACAMEASSIGLAEHRMAGVQIKVAIFTNFTQDHLDYHGSMDAYWEAKRSLFEWAGLESAVINVDDPKGQELVQLAKQRGLRLVTTSQHRQDAMLLANNMRFDAQGMLFDLHESDDVQTVRCPSIGGYNIANALGVIGAMQCLGITTMHAIQALAQCMAVPGRMEMLGASNEPLLVVDYAHTPDALTQAIHALRPITAARGGQLWCVFGCGGNRDASKRPLMGRAAMAADKLVVTSDNPRNEAPEAIAAQVMQGIAASQTAVLHLQRAEAIALAVEKAQAQDVILVAGKGHEDYQEIAGVKHPFSDVAQARAALKQRKQVMA
ncbi:MAG: UDP-N-acetylmuramoyl-L-alanyl-D-glutamate--2,6-diaminopimelate ligase [Brachymonas sp.]|nr:UDP-N-acetylmuramoyl-L-alanyl-D-glutamate--2,6-diaminopimelate ligase [Brachymonas sp.]